MEDHRIVGLVRVVVLVGALLGGLGCSSSRSRFQASGNPLLDVRNPELLARDRVRAAEKAWAEVESGVRVRDRTREAFKSLAWSTQTDESVRLTLMRLLMSDTSEEGSADSRRMARLMLPTERAPSVVRVIAGTAAERGWTDTLPSLVRSWARTSPNVPDSDRPERAAIEALAPGRPAEETVYGVFLRPADTDREMEGAVLRVSERTRDDAWTLLSRLDTDGRLRARLIGDETPADADPSSAADVGYLRAGLRELGCLPRTGDELAWLRRLAHNEDEATRARNKAWWDETAAAIARLSDAQRAGLELRHGEAVRWAAAHRPAWLGRSREDILDELDARLSRRPHQTRDAPRGKRARSEKLRDWRDRMSWGDALTVLVVDEAMAAGTLRAMVFEQGELDRADTSTEYGGVIETVEGTEGLRAVLFRPRARDRMDDEVFIASGDMVRFSDRALAHYHLQVSSKRLSREAGPSEGDLIYAASSGRTCLVFTSIGSHTLNVDLYTPDAEVIDLGSVERP